MTEHEKLKQVCDVIGYDIHNPFIYFHQIGIICRESFISPGYKDVDVREIIFTPEFMEKFLEFYLRGKDGFIHLFNCKEFMNHLDDSVQYLYNLLELGKTDQKN